MPARTGSRRQRLWICRFAWTTQTRCPHTHSRRKSSSRKLLDLKDKGRRDYTLTSAIPGPSSGVHFKHVFILPEFQYRFPRAHLGKKPQGVERVFRWFRHCSVLFSASFGRSATLACLASSFKFYF